ncbi:N-acetylmuramoyl-L-alanine amidase, partial [Serratia sp. Se-PFBMAAmG]|nr:N-acetylmuramoyl-L-alanine amidase [Serratia sp. Se-PFBMAAmG]
MSKISLLKRLTNRRQLLLSGLALAVLSPRAVMAKEESADLRVSKGHTPPKPAASGKRIVMIDPGHGGIDSGAVGEEGSEEKHIVLAIAN